MGRLHRGCPHLLENTVGDLLDLRLAALTDHHAEAVAADPAHRVADARTHLQPLGQIEQHGVPGFVAEGVVDDRQAVDANGKVKAVPAIAPAEHHHVVQRPAQPRPAVEPGQDVVIRLVFEARLGAFAGGDDP